jgi:hypothetical protein
VGRTARTRGLRTPELLFTIAFDCAIADLAIANGALHVAAERGLAVLDIRGSLHGS